MIKIVSSSSILPFKVIKNQLTPKMFRDIYYGQYYGRGGKRIADGEKMKIYGGGGGGEKGGKLHIKLGKMP